VVPSCYTERSMRRTLATLLACLAIPAGSAVALDEVSSRSSLPPAAAPYVEATLAEARGEYRRAMDLYRKALAADPESAEVRVAFASLLVSLGLTDRAMEVLGPVPEDRLDWYGRRALGLALAQVSASNPLELPRAERVLREALAERPTDPNLVLSYAQVLEREGKLEEAERQIRRLRVGRAGNPQLLIFHAELLRRLGRDEEALELYRSCAAGGPSATVCRRELVDLLVAAGRPTEAADRIVSWLAPDDLDLMLEAANLYLDGGRAQKALGLIRRALGVDPGSPRALRMEAMALAARKAGLEYIANTEHSSRLTVAKGLDEKRLHEQLALIERLNGQLKDITILKGIEVDILEDGRLDLDDGILSQLMKIKLLLMT